MVKRRQIPVPLIQPKMQELKPAFLILEQGLSSVNSLADLYSRLTRTRGRGAPRHEEQDLLRAMVVMAGAALDATLKRLLTDAYDKVLNASDAAREKAADHLHRRILMRINEAEGRKLAAALLARSPRESLAELIVMELVSGSLQSAEQIARVSEYLGCGDVLSRKPYMVKVKAALEARNQIVHEMDALLGGTTKPGGKKRRQRKRNAMCGHAGVLIKVCAELLPLVDQVLSQGGAA